MKPIRLVLVAIPLALVLALSACSSGGGSNNNGGTTPGTGAAGTVVEKGLAFSPSTLEVKVGDTVTFTNEDSAPHNVRIDGEDLGTQSRGESVTWTAEKAGTFPYTCTIHPSMTGEVIVK